MRACHSIKRASELHADDLLMAVSSEDLVAKEAACHKTCYRDYTRVLSRTQENKNTNEGMRDDSLDLAFVEVTNYLASLRDNPKVIEHTMLTGILENKLRERNDIEDNS